ncbi:MAG: CDP-alcohol phosphatidyltransferase family protein [Alphaproteobacteria bacterium]|nr:CDP-alcohol phosphatidyltransferase family protein [Alphaproteobacteria bacterium]
MSSAENKNNSLITPPTILSFVKDLPNLCSLAGLCLAVLAIYFASVGAFPAAMIGLIWAVFFDWSDGIIARHMKNRTKMQQKFGGQLDSLIDIISFGVCPAIILLSYGEYSPWFVPGAFLIMAAGVLRLSYFNVFGLVEESTYQGLALDNNSLVLVSLFVFEGFINPSIFASLLYIILLVLAILNVAPIKTPKLGGVWYYGITAYALILTLFYGWQLLSADG